MRPDNGVAEENQHRTHAEVLAGNVDGVPVAQGIALVDERGLQVGVALAHPLPHLVAEIPHDQHDPVDAHGRQFIQNVSQDRFAGDM